MEKIEKVKQKRGRRKIEIKKIVKKSNLDVTFSKRRKGLFKKAGELSVLCGVDIAIIAFSPSQNTKPFTYGHPSADTIINRYVGGGSGGAAFSNYFDHCKKLEEYKKNYDESLLKQKENENLKKVNQWMIMKEDINIENGSKEHWWNKSIEEIGAEELEHYEAALKELKDKINTKLNNDNNNVNKDQESMFPMLSYYASPFG